MFFHFKSQLTKCALSFKSSGIPDCQNLPVMMPPSFCGYEKVTVSKQKENVKIGVENEKVLHMQDNEHLKEFYYVECNVLCYMCWLPFSIVR